MIKKYVNIIVYNKKYTVIVKVNPKTGTFVGQCKQLPEALSQGNSMHELLGNMREAIELVIECELTVRQDKLAALIEKAKRMDATVRKNNITMEEIVEEVKKVRHMRKD